jgi:hypothetical protein
MKIKTPYEKVNRVRGDDETVDGWKFENDLREKFFIAQRKRRTPMMEVKDGSRKSSTSHHQPTTQADYFDIYSFFFLAPLTLAVPRRVFCLFLRCLPVG